jgi:hypothetical protein
MHRGMLVAAAMVLGVTSEAEAAVFGPGENVPIVVNQVNQPDLYGSSPIEGAFTDIYFVAFNRDEPAVGSFRTTLTEVVGITDITIEFIEPLRLGGNPVIDRDPDILSFLLLGGFIGGDLGGEDPYVLKISGTAANGAFYTGTGLALQTPVPLALPMLGAALAGLASVGVTQAHRGA